MLRLGGLGGGGVTVLRLGGGGSLLQVRDPEVAQELHLWGEGVPGEQCRGLFSGANGWGLEQPCLMLTRIRVPVHKMF